MKSSKRNILKLKFNQLHTENKPTASTFCLSPRWLNEASNVLNPSYSSTKSPSAMAPIISDLVSIALLWRLTSFKEIKKKKTFFFTLRYDLLSWANPPERYRVATRSKTSMFHDPSLDSADLHWISISCYVLFVLFGIFLLFHRAIFIFFSPGILAINQICYWNSAVKICEVFGCSTLILWVVIVMSFLVRKKKCLSKLGNVFRLS